MIVAAAAPGGYRGGMVAPASAPLRQRLRDAAQQIQARTPLRPRIAMLLGSGHASIAGQLKDKVTVHGDDLGGGLHLPSPLQLGALDGIQVAIAEAPLLEIGLADVSHPVRLLRAIGCEVLILTAGAASLVQQLEPGSIAVLEDHLNLTGVQVLGKGSEELGPRFPDMTEPYAPKWRELAREVAVGVGIPLLPGVFAAVPGPSMPTRAEYRFLRLIGADLVGMSIVPEVIAAVHAGFQVLGLVGITQQILPDRSATASIEAMLDAAELAAPRMASLLVGIVAQSRELVG